MERVLVRIELDPETAKVVSRALSEQAQRVGIALGQDPPEHTRKALEAMRDGLALADREFTRAQANPIAVEIEGPSDTPLGLEDDRAGEAT
jgi:PAS domain-containing protein